MITHRTTETAIQYGWEEDNFIKSPIAVNQNYDTLQL